MRRVFMLLVVVVLLGGAAWIAWGVYGPKPQLGYAQVFATAPAPCPDDPNDLAGIEGWAPGAGKTEKIGQTNAGSLGGFGGALGGDASTPAPAADTKKCTGISPELDAYFKRIEATGEAIPATEYDAAAKASALSGDAPALFAFVRDQILTDPYSGAMRGANGTLAARAGSPADKALLLAALLSEKHIPVRFVHGVLTQTERQTVLASILTAKPRATAADEPDVWKKLGLDRGQVESLAQEQRARVKQLADEGIARASSATDALLSSAGVKLATTDADARNEWSAGLQQHWWLQAQLNGTWTDLDPTLPSAAVGAHLGTADQEPVDALPDTAYVWVELTLTGTFLENGAATDKKLVSATAKTADLALTSFSVVIGDRTKGAQNLTEARSFTPAIMLGSAEQTGDPFEPDGTSRLAALHLSIATASPEESPLATVKDRTLLDRRARGGTTIDPAWTPDRTALALTGTFMGLVVAGELNRDFTAKQDAQAAKLARAFSAYVTAGGNGRQIPPPGESAKRTRTK